MSGCTHVSRGGGGESSSEPTANVASLTGAAGPTSSVKLSGRLRRYFSLLVQLGNRGGHCATGKRFEPGGTGQHRCGLAPGSKRHRGCPFRAARCRAVHDHTHTGCPYPRAGSAGPGGSMRGIPPRRGSLHTMGPPRGGPARHTVTRRLRRLWLRRGRYNGLGQQSQWAWRMLVHSGDSLTDLGGMSHCSAGEAQPCRRLANENALRNCSGAAK